MKKIRVGILGATGMVGQNYIVLLKDHPWFEVSYLAASERSAGKSYSDTMMQRWRQPEMFPGKIGELMVHRVGNIEEAAGQCDLLFSAFNQKKESIKATEKDYAAAGLPVVSNNSAHRLTENVPIIMPEVNPDLLKIIPMQQEKEGWDRGFIVTKPNCGVQSYVLPIAALRKAGLEIEQIITTNLQALSGAGYPGQSALDVIDNIIALPSEEEKACCEPQKIFGSIEGDLILPDSNLEISSNCIRVPVVHGHTSCVWFSVRGKQPEIGELEEIFRSFRADPQELDLPSAPDPAIRYFREPSHPQPQLDRDADGGMAVTVGRLQRSPVLGYRFTALSHNTRRGAAGGGVLTAELLVKKGYVKSEAGKQ